MGDWKSKPRKDWSLKPREYRSSPLISAEEARRYNEKLAAERKPNPFLVMAGGLRHGDHLFVDWLDDRELRLNGCRVAAYRDRVLLKWAPAGWLRDTGGRCLYAPYLKTLSAVDDFVHMLATACGYTASVLEEGPTRRRFLLETVVGESRRIISGDQLRYDPRDKTLRVERQQGTVDMNLYKPTGSSCILNSTVDYASMTHHPPVIVRAIAEANGLWVKQLEDGAFLAVPPS